MSDVQADTQNELLDSLLGDFLDESDQLLTQLNERLLQLDEWVHALTTTTGALRSRLCSTKCSAPPTALKGCRPCWGSRDINDLTHKIENVFDAARKNELTVNGDVTELVFMGLDQLAALVERLKQPGGEPVDCDVP